MTTRPLELLLQQHAASFHPVIPTNLNSNQVCCLDFSANNSIWVQQDLRDTAAFNDLVNTLLANQHATVGVGGYLENRAIYHRSAHFNEQEEQRTIHLGVDIWVAAFTPVAAPLNAEVHSFQDNAQFGDYGPTIILKHNLEGETFYTLYGHLTRTSLNGLYAGKKITKGEAFAQVGPFPENGDWPPHLHFQVMTDILGLSGDFPGVCTLTQKDYFAQICINPNLILQSLFLN